MKASSSQGEAEIAEINMTPFVDIVLVLLIIFMATATFVAQGKIPLKLPKASSQLDRQSNSRAVTISITKDGKIYYEALLVGFGDLEQKISGDSTAKDRGVILRSDAKAEFENVVKVIDICKKYDIDKFAIQTKMGE